MLNHPIALKPSRLLALFLLFTHFGAICAVLMVALPLLVQALLIVLVLFSLIENLRQYVLLLSANAIIEIQPQADNVWLLTTKGGKVLEAKLLQSSYRSFYLLVLNFAVIGAKANSAVIILPDNLLKDIRQQLFLASVL